MRSTPSATFSIALGSRLSALVLSAALHAGVAALVAGHGPDGSPRASAQPSRAELQVDLVTASDDPRQPAEFPRVAPPTPNATHPARAATHTHSYPVAASHDATPHAPDVVHAPFAPPPSPAPAAPHAEARHDDDGAVRFTLSVPPAPHGAAHGHDDDHGHAGAASSGGDDQGSREIVAEAGVDHRATLLASPPPAYPLRAREAGVEADVPVEIVVDARGAVIAARATTHAGYGLDEAATEAVRAYRFTPARRAGRVVSVRMLWRVQFRLN